MRAKYIERRNLTETIQTFYFEPERPLRFTAGQFTELTIPHKNPDERGTRREFTISSSPTETRIAVTTRVGSQDESTFKHALELLQKNDEVELADAMGDFVLPKITTLPLVFIAGGIGVTPYLSILKYLRDTEQVRDTRLFYCVRSEEDIINIKQLTGSNIPTSIFVTEPSTSWGGLQGVLSAERVAQQISLSPDTQLFLSGPEGLIQSLEAQFIELGTNRHQLVTDAFRGYKNV